MDTAPRGLRRTPDGPGPEVRYDLGHRPLPDIPLPMDTATWPDPTSRTGLRINASLVAPTNIERQARERFAQMEGWGTFAPISVSFDVDRSAETLAKYPDHAGYTGAALDLANVKQRHQNDDYDFANDAVYLVNLKTGVPVVLDIGAKNFEYTIKRLDKYWANDTRVTERNLLFETRDESDRGSITPELFLPEHDTDFDGVLDVPNLDDPYACPEPDLERCDRAGHMDYASDECFEMRRSRDRCVADHLMYWYERETDSLILRPLLPMDEMTRYAVVITDRLVDAMGAPVRSPFEFVYHAAQESTAAEVKKIIDRADRAAYFGDIAKTGLDHVAFVWGFTTQPTVDDMKRLRDGLYGQGPFARWATSHPAEFELQRAVGKNAGLYQGATDVEGWVDDEAGKLAGCPNMVPDPQKNPYDNLYIIHHEDIAAGMHDLVVEGFDVSDGPAVDLMLRQMEHIDYMLIGTFKSPFLLKGADGLGPKSKDPNAAFDLNYVTGQGYETTDRIQFWLIVPKETAQFKPPFDVNVYGHGYTGYFVEQLIYAGNMAAHGLATIGINAMGHGVVFEKEAEALGASAALASVCAAPFYDALTDVRARDLDNDGVPDSGGDFWSSYLFHTRDGVRQSILDHLQLVRIMRSWGAGGTMKCRNEKTGWDKAATDACDFNGDGKPEIAGDFNGDGKLDVGGPDAIYGTWGESLGGILSAIHGSIDAYVTAAVPGSGGGGLTDIGIRSFQGGVIEAVLLRIWGPLIVSVPAAERNPCNDAPPSDANVFDHNKHCTTCVDDQVSLRWVVPDVNGTGEVEITCLEPEQLADTTVFVRNTSNEEKRCARVSDDLRFRIGIPASFGDGIQVEFYEGKDMVTTYDGCVPKPELVGKAPKTLISQWGAGFYPQGFETDLLVPCHATSCAHFQGKYYGEGEQLSAVAEGFGQVRQTPSSRRFIQLAQTALEPGDPISFAPYYSIRQMTDPFGKPIAPHAVLTLNTIGDMNVPLNSGIAFARATGALPFFRPDQAAQFPEYANYVTPQELYDALGSRTPNQELIDQHVIEGITALARHPAGPECLASANAKAIDGSYTQYGGETGACFPGPMSTPPPVLCNSDPRTTTPFKCFSDTSCDGATGQCLPNPLGNPKCDEALWDADDLDEGKHLYYENNSPVPQRLARYTQPATVDTIDDVWQPRLKGVPFGADGKWKPDPARPLTGLLDAYTVPEGEHTFVNGEPCQGWDHGTYLTNLVARFFMTNGSDVYYLSHPTTHHCLAAEDVATSCDYIEK